MAKKTKQSTAGKKAAGKNTAGKSTAGKKAAGKNTAGKSTAGKSTAGKKAAGKKAVISQVSDFVIPKLTKDQEKYLERRIDRCVKSYPAFSREEAKVWLLKNNKFTRVIQ